MNAILHCFRKDETTQYSRTLWIHCMSCMLLFYLPLTLICQAFVSMLGHKGSSQSCVDLTVWCQHIAHHHPFPLHTIAHYSTFFFAAQKVCTHLLKFCWNLSGIADLLWLLGLQGLEPNFARCTAFAHEEGRKGSAMNKPCSTLLNQIQHRSNLSWSNKRTTWVHDTTWSNFQFYPARVRSWYHSKSTVIFAPIGSIAIYCPYGESILAQGKYCLCSLSLSCFTVPVPSSTLRPGRGTVEHSPPSSLTSNLKVAFTLGKRLPRFPEGQSQSD